MRVMTWNVWWRFGEWEQRREAILAELRRRRPDVVGLQEVWQADGENLAGWLAERLGMHWAWAEWERPERWHARLGAEVGIGVAVLSRWPVLERAVVPLPGAEGADDGRLALHALVDAPEHPVPFFTAHLEPAPDASALRCRQVAALAGFIAEHREASAFPPVSTGDFNAWPDSDEVRMFGGYKTAPPLPGHVMVDAWGEYADPSAPSATWDMANPQVAAGGGPNIRIDYVHVGLPGPGGLGRVRAVERAGTAPIGGVWPSDHMAVLTDLVHPGADGGGR